MTTRYTREALRQVVKNLDEFDTGDWFTVVQQLGKNDVELIESYSQCKKLQ